MGAVSKGSTVQSSQKAGGNGASVPCLEGPRACPVPFACGHLLGHQHSPSSCLAAACWPLGYLLAAQPTRPPAPGASGVQVELTATCQHLLAKEVLLGLSNLNLGWATRTSIFCSCRSPPPLAALGLRSCWPSRRAMGPRAWDSLAPATWASPTRSWWRSSPTPWCPRWVGATPGVSPRCWHWRRVSRAARQDSPLVLTA
jgi:hypothetical protein